jgi:hypothetical protein
MGAAIVHRAERTYPPASGELARRTALLAGLQRHLFGKGNGAHAVAIATVIEEMQLAKFRLHLYHHYLRNVGVPIQVALKRVAQGKQKVTPSTAAVNVIHRLVREQQRIAFSELCEGDLGWCVHILGVLSVNFEGREIATAE